MKVSLKRKYKTNPHHQSYANIIRKSSNHTSANLMSPLSPLLSCSLSSSSPLLSPTNSIIISNLNLMVSCTSIHLFLYNLVPMSASLLKMDKFIVSLPQYFYTLISSISSLIQSLFLGFLWLSKKELKNPSFY